MNRKENVDTMIGSERFVFPDEFRRYGAAFTFISDMTIFFTDVVVFIDSL